jgi:hypothetical protein
MQKANTYNGYSIEHIENNMPKNIHPVDRAQYLKNVKRVIEIQQTGVNTHEIETLKNSNWFIISLYTSKN